MKIRRYRKVNKHLGFYINNFGFRQPYQILIDGTFCHAALKNQIQIADNIPKYLQDNVKLLTTQCAVIELEDLGPKLNGALVILKQFAIHKCGHERKPILGSQCLLSMLGKNNENHYILATQDRDLQDKVRGKPGVPLLYLHMRAPVLEKPSEASEKAAKNKLAGLCKRELEDLERLKVANGLVTIEEKPKKKKKKKGPNPLSCKKKKQKSNVESHIVKKEGKPEIEKKKRKRIKIPKHVKEMLTAK